MDKLETFGDGFLFSTQSKTWADRRIIAVDTRGRQTPPVEVREQGEAGTGRSVMRFPVPVRRIREIWVETRPYTWTEFKDVALQPQDGTERKNP